MLLNREEVSLLKKSWVFTGEIVFHRRVANYVYFSKINDREVVLRLTELNRRGKEEIASELDWMRYLSENDLSVVAPVATKTGEMILSLSGERPMTAVVFEKALGQPLTDEQMRDEGIIHLRGQFLGKLHHLTQKYKCSAGVKPRVHWNQDSIFKDAKRSLDPNDAIPFQRFIELTDWLSSLPIDKESYGLAHCDLHSGNFFLKDNQITAFDFDDSCFHWLIYDFVPPIISMNLQDPQGVFSKEKQRSLEIFLRGYNQHFQLDQQWIDRYPCFEYYSAVQVYHWVKTGINEAIFSGAQLAWAENKVVQMRKVLEKPIDLF